MMLVLQVRVAQKVTTGVYKGVTTSELDELAAETAASMTATHPDYAIVSNAHLPLSCQSACRASRIALTFPPRASACQVMKLTRSLLCSWLPASPSPTCTRTRSSRSRRREFPGTVPNCADPGLADGHVLQPWQ